MNKNKNETILERIDKMAMSLEPVISKLEKFIIYETHAFIYVVGCDKRQLHYRVMKLDRKVGGAPVRAQHEHPKVLKCGASRVVESRLSNPSDWMTSSSKTIASTLATRFVFDFCQKYSRWHQWSLPTLLFAHSAHFFICPLFVSLFFSCQYACS